MYKSKFQENTEDQAVKILNELVSLDKDAIEKLVNYRVKCNETLAEHPTAQVGKGNTIGLVGVLNAIFGKNEDGVGFIAAVVNDEGNLESFTKTKDIE